MNTASLLALLLLIYYQNSYAQAGDSRAQEEQIKKTINNLFSGMKTADSALVASAFPSTAIMQTIVRNADGKAATKTQKVGDFLAFVGSAEKGRLDEQIVFTKILIDEHLASVWTNYKFFADNKFSHCGVNSFQLLNDGNGWKIIYLIDTRRKENCNP